MTARERSLKSWEGVCSIEIVELRVCGYTDGEVIIVRQGIEGCDKLLWVFTTSKKDNKGVKREI